MGLNLDDCFNATLNLSIYPYSFAILNPDYTFENVQWLENIHPETFSFVKCKIEYMSMYHNAWIYYPHPETKVDHNHSSSVIEVITEFIKDIAYNDNVIIHIPTNKIIIKKEAISV